MINPQWLKPPMSRTIFYGPKDVRAIEVRLYVALYCTESFIIIPHLDMTSIIYVERDITAPNHLISCFPQKIGFTLEGVSSVANFVTAYEEPQ